MSAFPGAAGAPSATQPTDPAPVTAPTTPREACPLCGTPLRADQDWCLHCGAAARTRLAAPPKWKGLVIALVTVAALSLAVLAVALVKLVG